MRVESPQRREGGGLVEQPRELGRHDRHESQVGLERLRRAREGDRVEWTLGENDGLGLARERTHEHVEPGDVVGRQGEQPLAVAADGQGGGRGAREESIRAQRDTLGSRGRAARLHHERDAIRHRIGNGGPTVADQHGGTAAAERIPQRPKQDGRPRRHDTQRPGHRLPNDRFPSTGRHGPRASTATGTAPSRVRASRGRSPGPRRPRLSRRRGGWPRPRRPAGPPSRRRPR